MILLPPLPPTQDTRSRSKNLRAKIAATGRPERKDRRTKTAALPLVVARTRSKLLANNTVARNLIGLLRCL